MQGLVRAGGWQERGQHAQGSGLRGGRGPRQRQRTKPGSRERREEGRWHKVDFRNREIHGELRCLNTGDRSAVPAAEDAEETFDLLATEGSSYTRFW